MLEVRSNSKIDFIVFAITMMLHRSLAESAGHFWWPAEFENVAKPDFGNLKHLQNSGHLPLTEASSVYMIENIFEVCLYVLQISRKIP